MADTKPKQDQEQQELQENPTPGYVPQADKDAAHEADAKRLQEESE